MLSLNLRTRCVSDISRVDWCCKELFPRRDDESWLAVDCRVKKDVRYSVGPCYKQMACDGWAVVQYSLFIFGTILALHAWILVRVVIIVTTWCYHFVFQLCWINCGLKAFYVAMDCPYHFFVNNNNNHHHYQHACMLMRNSEWQWLMCWAKSRQFQFCRPI